MQNYINHFKLGICTATGAVGSFMVSLFGGWSADMTTLLIFMGIDLLTGWLLAGVFKKSSKTQNGALESKASFRGLCKKCGILLCVLVSYRLDLALGTTYIKTAVVIGFMVNELISLVENIGLMGVPMPPQLTKAIELLKNKSEEENNYD